MKACCEARFEALPPGLAEGVDVGGPNGVCREDFDE